MDNKEFHSRLKEIMAEKQMTIYKLAEESGICRPTLYTMIKRGTLPHYDNYVKICNGLGHTVESFEGKVDVSDIDFTEVEHDIVEIMHELTPAHQNMLLSYGKALFDMQKKIKNK